MQLYLICRGLRAKLEFIDGGGGHQLTKEGGSSYASTWKPSLLFDKGIPGVTQVCMGVESKPLYITLPLWSARESKKFIGSSE